MGEDFGIKYLSLQIGIWQIYPKVFDQCIKFIKWGDLSKALHMEIFRFQMFFHIYIAPIVSPFFTGRPGLYSITPCSLVPQKCVNHRSASQGLVYAPLDHHGFET